MEECQVCVNGNLIRVYPLAKWKSYTTMITGALCQSSCESPHNEMVKLQFWGEKTKTLPEAKILSLIVQISFLAVHCCFVAFVRAWWLAKEKMKMGGTVEMALKSEVCFQELVTTMLVTILKYKHPDVQGRNCILIKRSPDKMPEWWVEPTFSRKAGLLLFLFFVFLEPTFCLQGHVLVLFHFFFLFSFCVSKTYF